jgi:hypothetical protein
MGRPARTVAASLALRACIRLGMLAPTSAFSRAACAGMANLLLWSAAAESLGAGRPLFSLLDDAASDSGAAGASQLGGSARRGARPRMEHGGSEPDGLL